MSQPPNYGSPGGSVKRARERAQAGLPAFAPSDPSSDLGVGLRPRPKPAGPQTGMPANPRPQAPPGFQRKDGTIGMAISRPMPVPQWPLASGSASSGGERSFQPPDNQSQSPPRRPPRPSRVPSILDGSKVQDPTPVFQYAPQRASEQSVPETTGTSSSRPSTEIGRAHV